MRAVLWLVPHYRAVACELRLAECRAPGIGGRACTPNLLKMKVLILDTAAIEKAEEYKRLLTMKFSPGQKNFVIFIFVGMLLLSAVLFGYNLIKALQIHNDLLYRKAHGLVSPRVPVVSGFHVTGPGKKKDARNGGGGLHNALSDKFIAKVNSRDLPWQAGRNFDVNTPMAYIKKLMGAKRDQSMKVVATLLSVHKPPLVANQPLPIEFDARDKWPQCKSISEIRDQGGCGSCWAICATQTMSDRQCIHKNETFIYSAADIVSCCDVCGSGCDGGFPVSAFVQWKTNGIVSGGAYDSHQGCSPYEVEPCKHLVPGKRISCSGSIKTPDCTKQCAETYNSTYGQDLRFAHAVYTLSHEEEILRDLVENGPVAASFDVYEDFLHYKSGVYFHVEGSLLGGHAVKILGFGVEGGVPYYLCANSWNYDWGNGGFFKIRRDQMYEDMVAGIPA